MSEARWLTPAVLHLLLLALLLLAGCGAESENGAPADAQPIMPDAAGMWTPVAQAPALPTTETLPGVDLVLEKKDVTVAPLPLRAGFPFTITAVIHNRAGSVAPDVPVVAYISPLQVQPGFSPFLDVLTVTVPATRPLSVQIPVRWNLSGGEHRLWLQVNRLPQAWATRTPLHPEDNTRDNTVFLDLTIQPFDTYASTLCAGRVDVEIDRTAIVAVPGEQSVGVRLLNAGNRAVYHLPVIVLGEGVTGLAYTPAIPPCGGTALVSVDLDRTLRAGESLTVEVNPADWSEVMAEDERENNRVLVTVAPVAGAAGLALPTAEDYDFRLSNEEIEMPQAWIVVVRVQNLGTRDAAMVPIRVQNQAGRTLTDAIPFVQGNGWGVAAIRVGYLWSRGGTLTFTVNPKGVRGSYPESNRDDNIATFTLP